MKTILLKIGGFLLELININSDMSSKRVCLIGFMSVVTIMWVVMSIVQRQLAAIDAGVVAIIIGLATAATGDHFAAAKNGNGKINGENK